MRVSMNPMKLIGSIFTTGTLVLLSSCSLVQQQTQETDTAVAAEAEKPTQKNKKTDNSAQPTPEQMETAMQVMKEYAVGPAEDSAEMLTVTAAETVPEPDVIPGGLRMGRFAPPEEAVSSSDNDMPAPNSVELHGFRSPNLKGGTLPMNINGKINKPE